MAHIRAVVFDSGETLIDETRAWEEWADWLGVPRFTFVAVLGGVIARGEYHQRVFELLRPDFDMNEAIAERERSGMSHQYVPKDLYPDVRSCLDELRSEGYRLGIAGNYSVESERALQQFGLPVDFVASSESWRVEKPSPEFFERIVGEVGFPASEIAYVGDRPDNDVAGAVAAGLFAVLLARGPWAYLHADHPAVKQAGLRIRSLDALPPDAAPKSYPSPASGG